MVYQIIRRSTRATSTRDSTRGGAGRIRGSLIRKVRNPTCKSMDSRSGRVGKLRWRWALRKIQANCQLPTGVGEVEKQVARFDRMRRRRNPRGSSANAGIARETGRPRFPIRPWEGFVPSLDIAFPTTNPARWESLVRIIAVLGALRVVPSTMFQFVHLRTG